MIECVETKFFDLLLDAEIFIEANNQFGYLCQLLTSRSGYMVNVFKEEDA